MLPDPRPRRHSEPKPSFETPQPNPLRGSVLRPYCGRQGPGAR
jgi:hypothetical protein